MEPVVLIVKSPVFLEFPRKHLKNSIGSLVQPSIVIPFFELGDNDPLDDPFGQGIGQGSLYAIAGIDRHPAVPFGQEYQHAIVLIALADAPFLAPLRAQIVDVLPFGGPNDGDDDLGRGTVRITDQLVFQIRFLGRGQQVYVVIYTGLLLGLFRYGELGKAKAATA